MNLIQSAVIDASTPGEVLAGIGSTARVRQGCLIEFHQQPHTESCRTRRALAAAWPGWKRASDSPYQRCSLGKCRPARPADPAAAQECLGMLRHQPGSPYNRVRTDVAKPAEGFRAWHAAPGVPGRSWNARDMSHRTGSAQVNVGLTSSACLAHRRPKTRGTPLADGGDAGQPASCLFISFMLIPATAHDRMVRHLMVCLAVGREPSDPRLLAGPWQENVQRSRR